ncbi:TauD/TfdA dioxygenase family protein [Zavarzinia sp. CC-PAN008]|uniref:TauD/TfdA dioxygenase family protein n=1 Tax=Zavarzinia sp. CC-PAN008 TaxID=3243332 RepID=UPI003F74868A
MVQPASFQHIQTRPIHDSFGVEITNLGSDGNYDEATWAEIRQALFQHRAILLRNQPNDPDRMVAWSRRFGIAEHHIDAKARHDTHPEIIVIGNLWVDGVLKSLFVNAKEEWHFDYSYAAQPSLGSLFYAVEVPPSGGDTLFADSTQAYDDLDAATRARLEGLVAVHSWEQLHEHLMRMDPTRKPLSAEALAKYPPVRHPLVFTNPQTGRKSLWLCHEDTLEVEGLGAEAGRQLVWDLTQHVTSPRYVYRHRWQPGDLLLYDNRALMHTATVFDFERHRRIMYRTTILQDAA